ncbi:MAG: helix-hairpin-helix domain-containing protein [Acidimicrobiia bacterium]
MSASDPAQPPLDRLLGRPPDRLDPDQRAHGPAVSFEFWGRDRSGLGRPPGVRWFERLRDDPRVGVAALLATALVAGVLWYRIGVDASADEPLGASTSSPASVPTRTPSPTRAGSDGGSTTEGSGKNNAELNAELVVHVAGAVVRPGIVRLRAGARVVDAIEGAGGARPEADLDQLNLAAKVADGQRIGVGLPGQPVPAPGSSGVAGGTATGTDGFGGASTGLLNLNTATQTEIETLPGIGPVLGAAILRERDERGGFRAVDELRSVRGIGEKRFADLRDLVTV